MSSTPAIRSFLAGEWRTYKDLRLASLADSPDAFGSTLAKEQSGGDEQWAERLAAGCASGFDLPLLAELNGTPVGLAWGRIDPAESSVAHLYQMWVAPAARGLGVGRLLLDAFIDWGRSKQVTELALSVTCGNTPAMRLYRRAGFEPAGPAEPLRPGSNLLAQPMCMPTARSRPRERS